MGATRELLIVDALVVLYALCYQLQVPLEPYLVDRLVTNVEGGSADAIKQFTQLQSFFSIVQMVGSMFVGGLVDVLGVRFAFVLNFAACALSYAILASAESMTGMAGLYVSKLPAVFMTGFLCAQAAVAQLTKPGAGRAEELGKLTMACVGTP